MLKEIPMDFQTAFDTPIVIGLRIINGVKEAMYLASHVPPHTDTRPGC
jgi:hypothetical protein